MADTVLTILLVILIILLIFPFLLTCGISSMICGTGGASGAWFYDTIEQYFGYLYDEIDDAVQYVEQMTIDFFDDMGSAIEDGWNNFVGEMEGVFGDIEGAFEDFAHTLETIFTKGIDDMIDIVDQGVTIMTKAVTLAVDEMEDVIFGAASYMTKLLDETCDEMLHYITLATKEIVEAATGAAQWVEDECEKIIDTVGGWFGL